MEINRKVRECSDCPLFIDSRCTHTKSIKGEANMLVCPLKIETVTITYLLSTNSW